MRVVIELKRDAVADVVLNQLYRFTPLQGLVRLQLRRPERRPAGVDEPQGHPRRPSSSSARKWSTRRAPLPAQQGPRPRPCPGWPRRRGGQHRRSHSAHSHGARPGRCPRATDGAQLAGSGCRAADRADRRSAPPINEDGTFRLSDEQARAILALTLSRLTALGRDEIGDELNGLGDEIEDYLDILRSRERVVDDRPRRTDRDPGPVRHPAADRDRRRRRRLRGRGPHRARGHGRHRHPRRLHQARAAQRPIARSAAAARVARAWRRATRISFRACSSPTPIPRCCSSVRSDRSTSSRSGACRSPNRRLGAGR